MSGLINIVDGFTYNTAYNPVQRTFWNQALAQLDVLRRASNYRPRWWVIPQASQDPSITTPVPPQMPRPVQPYEQYDEQVEVAPGSWLWGYNFVVLKTVNPSNQVITNDNSMIQINVWESCTRIPIFQDFVSGKNCSSTRSSRKYPILMSKPRPILEPGLLSVSLANTGANTITCQLLLMFAEQCTVIEEAKR